MRRGVNESIAPGPVHNKYVVFCAQADDIHSHCTNDRPIAKFYARPTIRSLVVDGVYVVVENYDRNGSCMTFETSEGEPLKISEIPGRLQLWIYDEPKCRYTQIPCCLDLMFELTMTCPLWEIRVDGKIALSIGAIMVVLKDTDPRPKGGDIIRAPNAYVADDYSY
jgi:hypothetical protein